MASWEDVSRIALALPETVEATSYGQRAWKVTTKGFLWERPLRPADLDALGDAAPDGPVLGVRVADVGVKAALIADNPEIYFTIPHFDGYPAVLVHLYRIGVAELAELAEEAWLTRAPKRLAQRLLADRG
ncbi:MmcQ/YjbR family DNA-binding protein [Pseudofrankia asymbiotica]|uniref:MmcQ/YjbR family DNA-binding protein n=1 Tax=Pseudofrankia asymbiotica TaxID=1834516 RepID=A0A1V2I151_9ACTN|nr:hypothetical protein [Pseudofrankia asymbiotica]ONH22755.1 hypothetical protein BL253_34750 [Pseudofrankia asymbiotica]